MNPDEQAQTDALGTYFTQIGDAFIRAVSGLQEAFDEMATGISRWAEQSAEMARLAAEAEVERQAVEEMEAKDSIIRTILALKLQAGGYVDSEGYVHRSVYAPTEPGPVIVRSPYRDDEAGSYVDKRPRRSIFSRDKYVLKA